MDYTASIIEKIVVERNKKVDSAVMMEIQKIAVENGIETKFVLNEKNIISALKKQTARKVRRCKYTIFCPNCDEVLDLPEVINYCYYCGQALDWKGGEGK